jgi:hypothetical protein
LRQEELLRMAQASHKEMNTRIDFGEFRTIMTKMQKAGRWTQA